MKARSSAFTLLEIMLAMVVIGIMATIAIPRLTRKSPDTTLEAIINEINNLVYFARQEAISNQNTYRLHFFTQKNGNNAVQIEVESDDPEKPNRKLYNTIKSSYFNTCYTLPNIIEITAVYHGKEEQLSENKRNAYCYIIPDGLVQDILIHLTRTEKNQQTKVTLKMLPFFGKFELFKGFVKPEK